MLASFERKQNAFLLLINACFIPVLTAVATVAAVLCLEAVVPDGFGAITGRQPFWLQIIEAVVLVDLGVYVSHRLLHTRYLWRFHEVHHSAEEMNWFVAFRFHPVDLGINAILTTIPAVLLGLSIEAIAVAKLINGWQSTISHANVWLGLGPLRRIFIDPGFHHWHHANDRDAYDRNFGGLLVVWDSAVRDAVCAEPQTGCQVRRGWPRLSQPERSDYRAVPAAAACRRPRRRRSRSARYRTRTGVVAGA